MVTFCVLTWPFLCTHSPGMSQKCIQILSSSKDTYQVGLRSTLTPHFNSITSLKALCPCWGPGDRVATYEFLKITLFICGYTEVFAAAWGVSRRGPGAALCLWCMGFSWQWLLLLHAHTLLPTCPSVSLKPCWLPGLYPSLFLRGAAAHLLIPAQVCVC